MIQISTDDLAFLDSLILDTDPDQTTNERRDEVMGELISLTKISHADSPIAERILVWGAQRKVLDRINQIEHEPRVRVQIGEEERDIAKRYANTQFDPASHRASGYVQTVWLDMVWPEFMKVIDRQKAQHQTLQENIEILDRVAALRDKYPDTRTPREACTLDGMNPDIVVQFA